MRYIFSEKCLPFNAAAGWIRKEKEEYIKVYGSIPVNDTRLQMGSLCGKEWTLVVRNDCRVAVRVHSWLEHKTTPQTALAHFPKMTIALENGLQWQWVFRWDTPRHWAGTVRQTAIYSELLLLRASLLECNHSHMYACTRSPTYTHTRMDVHKHTQTITVWHQGQWIMTN